MREPTFDHQLRVAVVGDSLAAGLGYFAERVLKPFFVEVYKQGRISTGLARPDYFDWPAQMQRSWTGPTRTWSLVMLGENDNQGLLNGTGRSSRTSARSTGRRTTRSGSSGSP